MAVASHLFVMNWLEAGLLCRPFNHEIESDFGLNVVAPRSPRNHQHVQRMRDWLLSWN